MKKSSGALCRVTAAQERRFDLAAAPLDARHALAALLMKADLASTAEQLAVDGSERIWRTLALVMVGVSVRPVQKLSATMLESEVQKRVASPPRSTPLR